MTTPVGSPDVTNDDKLWAALAYVLSPIIPIILMLMEDKKNRPYIRFHAVQALAVGIAIWVVATVISPFTCGLSFILWVVLLYFGYKAYQGETFNIPFVTDFIKNQGWV